MKDKKILIVSPFGYDPWDYEVFDECKKHGLKLYHLGNGTFSPKTGVFEEEIHTDLRKIKETVDFVTTKGIHFDGITQACFEAATPLVSALVRAFKANGNSPQAAFACRNKHLMRESLNKAGLPSVKTFRCTSSDEVIAAARKLGQCVAKPIAAHSSFGTFFIDQNTTNEMIKERYDRGIKSIDTAIEHGDLWPFTKTDLEFLGIDDSGDLQHDYVVEEYIPGPELSIESIVLNGTVHQIAVAAQERMEPPFFVQLSETMPWDGNTYEQSLVADLNKKAICALGINTGATHCEIILSPTGPKIVEIAARMGGDNIQDSVIQTTGVNMMRELIRVALGLPPSMKPQHRGFAAMRYILPDKTGKLDEVIVPDEVKSHPLVTEVFTPHKHGEYFAPPPLGFDYLFYLSTKGKTKQEAQEILDWALSKIQVKLGA